MAFDTVIDKTQLEVGLTIVADAIRAKGGTTDKLDFPDEYVTAVEAIESGGLDTSDATATPDTVANGKTFYAGGKKQTGNVLAPSPVYFGYGTPRITNTSINISKSSNNNYYVKKGTTVGIEVDTANFGNAKAEDVVKGKTFTSTAGLKVTGTYEPPVSAGGVSF